MVSARVPTPKQPALFKAPKAPKTGTAPKNPKARKAPHLTRGAASYSDRWFTPPSWRRDIRRFFGGDYFDPCPATHPGEAPPFNGLAVSWAGKKVYGNFPYQTITPWVTKALTEPVEEAILLVPVRAGSGWWQALWGTENPILFIRGRLRFSGATQGGTFDSALVYIGPRREAFYHAFHHRGVVSQRMAPPEAPLWDHQPEQEEIPA